MSTIAGWRGALIGRSYCASMAQSIRRIHTPAERGLCEFFDDPTGWKWDDSTPVRSWKEGELGRKSFLDLHKLWWISIKHKNRLLSQKAECELLRLHFPRSASLKAVEGTMKSIRKVLWERLMERRRALKTLEIAREIVKSEDGAGGEISKEQKEEILFSGFTHRQKMDYMRAVKEIEEEKKLESNNPKLENFLSL